MTEAAIVVEELRKSYGDLSAVDGISFSVPKGQIVSFLGPNGAGKTTTVEILEGLRERSGGEVRVLGLDPWKDGAQLHRRIGVIPQGFRFFDKVTPREAIRYYGVLFEKTVDPDGLLKRVLLDEKEDDTFDKLSGGQKQKLGLALALVNDPEVLFLDEPTTGLDPQARRAVWEVIRQLKVEGRTVFLTTHYLEEAEELADHVSILNHGKILASGSPGDLIRRYGAAPSLVLTAGPDLADHLRKTTLLPVVSKGDKVRVSLTSKGDVIRVMAAVESSGLPWTDLATERERLEDVFITLVGAMDEGEVRK